MKYKMNIQCSAAYVRDSMISQLVVACVCVRMFIHTASPMGRCTTSYIVGVIVKPV